MRFLVVWLAAGLVVAITWAGQVGKLGEALGVILLTAIIFLLVWAAFRFLDAGKQLVKDTVRASERRPRAR